MGMQKNGRKDGRKDSDLSNCGDIEEAFGKRTEGGERNYTSIYIFGVLVEVLKVEKIAIGKEV